MDINLLFYLMYLHVIEILMNLFIWRLKLTLVLRLISTLFLDP